MDVAEASQTMQFHPPLIPSTERLRRVSYVSELAAARRQRAREPVGGVQRVAVHYAGQVVVLVVTGELTDSVEELDLTLQRALVEEPRGVVCDLSAAGGVSISRAQRMMALGHRHLRTWAGTPVAVGCPDRQLRRALCSTAEAGSPVVAASMLLAMSEVLATEERPTEFIRLTADPMAPYAARMFVSRALRDWGLGHRTFNACLVVGELVTNALRYAGPKVDVSVAAYGGAIRVAVRDQSPELPMPRTPALEPHGRGLLIVGRLCASWGVVSSGEGGKVVWAVLGAEPTDSNSV